jgi:predicted AlkP superfamily phosphohydrolase/phosphomutase
MTDRLAARGPARARPDRQETGICANRTARRALALSIAVVALVAAAGGAACRARETAAAGKRVIVLGFDGMDYAVARRLMEAGRMPNFTRLAASGQFGPLTTTVPPQSPVAWSSFITGLDPGAHGIFDFIHRDPATMVPYLSTTKTESAARTLKVGNWQIPLSSGTVTLLRHGQPFWEPLERRGVHTTIVRMPANFPPSGSANRELSGMGTPDLIGSYGTFSFYTSEPYAFYGQDVSGGRVQRVSVIDDVVTATLEGPDNPFRREPQKVTSEFIVYIDPERPVAKIVAGGEERVIAVGEWTDWVPVGFPLVPTQTLHGMVRFHLKQVRPEFELYVTPVNIDPMAQALPLSTPPSFAEDLARSTGRFYTQGMPEDTKALSAGVFSIDEFLRQARIAGEENERQYWRVLDGFRDGLLFYYFGNLDQVSHMMWRSMDPDHPGYDAARDGPYRNVIEDLYARFDRLVGRTMSRMGAGTMLLVMSDHGFASWRRAFHLNTWLEQHGYATLRDPKQRAGTLFSAVDWSKTRAYALGLNGLYVNLRGREKNGIVEPAERDTLVTEIADKLLKTIDPKTGQPAVTKVYRREQVYRDVQFPEITPDLIVGYAKGTRGSNQSALGEFPADVIVDNMEQWSGDHCMDHEAVPGILLSNRRLGRPASSLETLAAAVLAEFAVDGFPPNRASLQTTKR